MIFPQITVITVSLAGLLKITVAAGPLPATWYSRSAAGSQIIMNRRQPVRWKGAASLPVAVCAARHHRPATIPATSFAGLIHHPDYLLCDLTPRPPIEIMILFARMPSKPSGATVG